MIKQKSLCVIVAWKSRQHQRHVRIGATQYFASSAAHRAVRWPAAQGEQEKQDANAIYSYVCVRKHIKCSTSKWITAHLIKRGRARCLVGVLMAALSELLPYLQCIQIKMPRRKLHNAESARVNKKIAFFNGNLNYQAIICPFKISTL